METSNICSRPKRLRKDCSPTKLLAKSVPVDQSPCGVEASALSDDKTGAHIKNKNLKHALFDYVLV